MSLDGKKASQDELELSASIVGVKGHRRVSQSLSVRSSVCIYMYVHNEMYTLNMYL